MTTSIIIITFLILIILTLSYYALYQQYHLKNQSLSTNEQDYHLYSSHHTSYNEEQKMLKGILDMDKTTVYDVMNHRRNLFALDVDMPAKKMFDKIRTAPFSRIPLYQDKPENIIGIIRVKHFLKECVDKNNDFSKVKVREFMSKPWFIPENTSLLQQLKLFRARREHFACVVDEYGTLQGIVTLEDILEEIVGDINDESDIQNLDTMGIRKVDDNSYLADGQVPIRDLNRKFGWCISDDCAVTIAGYLLDMTQSIPEQGQKFVFEGFEFEIVKRNKNQISLVKITLQEKELSTIRHAEC